MRQLDWIVLIGFVVFTILYGIIKGRGSKTTRSYMLADKTMPWYAVALSIMATQASAITFVSATGQAYSDGMRFVQVYFGLPIAMVILCAVAVPLYHRLNVYTAYEYIERRFDLKTRTLTSVIFLVQRGLSDGLSVYASAIILSVILGWNVYWTLRMIGAAVVIYSVAGGVKGVNWNDFQQFLVIMGGMVVALFMTIYLLPSDISFRDAVSIAGVMGRLNAVDYSFDLSNRYNFWSGLIGGLFVSLSYFGTDQSQVQRYLTAKSIAQSRLGLLFNGLAKIPMQFFILFIGAMIFVFYQFVTPPLFFNPQEVSSLRFGQEFQQMEKQYSQASDFKKAQIRKWLEARKSGDENQQAIAKTDLIQANTKATEIRNKAIDLIKKTNPQANTNDTNYIFLTFVTHYLPAGLVGLVIVVVFAATMSSMSSELNSLATTTVIDLYKRMIFKNGADRHYLIAGKIATACWGIFAVSFAERLSHLGSLLEAVNILGSLFYGTVLGIFMLGFFFKKVGGTATFIGALVGEAIVLYLFKFTTISFLWYNVFGCTAVIACALLLSTFRTSPRSV
ncbi:MAG: sodium:solute symporter [Acidobacteria bacterium]|nr:MAG: sodium:solute symporter [Acidobacteriota bacterium]